MNDGLCLACRAERRDLRARACAEVTQLSEAEAAALRPDEYEWFALDTFLSHDRAREWLRRLARERLARQRAEAQQVGDPL